MSSKDIEEGRARYEASTREVGERAPSSMPGWAVARGDAEVRRQVDEDVTFDAISLVRSIDARRYWMPECVEIRDARAAALDALNSLAEALLDRSWALYRKEDEN